MAESAIRTGRVRGVLVGEKVAERLDVGEAEGNPMVPTKLYEHVGPSLTNEYPDVAPYE